MSAVHSGPCAGVPDSLIEEQPGLDDRPDSQPLKVLVSHFRPDIVSGAELAIADVVASRHPSVEFVMHVPGEGRLADHYRRAGFSVWVRAVQTRRRRYPGLHSVQSLLFAKALRKEGFSVVLCNTFPALSRVGTSCSISGIPLVVVVREYIRHTLLHRRLLAMAEVVLAVSRDVGRHLEKFSPAERVEVAYDPISIPALDACVHKHRDSAARSLPFDRRYPVVGLVGRITPYKQAHIFLDAVQVILDTRPDCRFVLVGSAVEGDRAYEARLRRTVLDKGLQDAVVFMGQRSDALEIISELTVLCVTSDREPFPRTLLEAQGIGCPVVASDSGGCPEMVEHGVTGLLFDARVADSPQRLAEQVLRLLGDSGLGSSLATEAGGRVRQTFGTTQPTRRIENLLRQARSRRRGGGRAGVNRWLEKLGWLR